jgi:hypothetical protein
MPGDRLEIPATLRRPRNFANPGAVRLGRAPRASRCVRNRVRVGRAERHPAAGAAARTPDRARALAGARRARDHCGGGAVRARAASAARAGPSATRRRSAPGCLRDAFTRAPAFGARPSSGSGAPHRPYVACGGVRSVGRWLLARRRAAAAPRGRRPSWPPALRRPDRRSFSSYRRPRRVRGPRRSASARMAGGRVGGRAVFPLGRRADVLAPRTRSGRRSCMLTPSTVAGRPARRISVPASRSCPCIANVVRHRGRWGGGKTGVTLGRQAALLARLAVPRSLGTQKSKPLTGVFFHYAIPRSTRSRWSGVRPLNPR